MNASDHLQLLTPDQLIHKYSQLEDLGWNASKIGTFFSAGLLLGKRRKKKAYILESSFKELVEYYNKVLYKCAVDLEHKKHLNFLTAEELLAKYPQVITLANWDASKIGIFLSSGLLRGKKNGTENKHLIQENSFVELVRYLNRVNKNRNVDL